MWISSVGQHNVSTPLRPISNPFEVLKKKTLRHQFRFVCFRFRYLNLCIKVEVFPWFLVTEILSYKC